VRSQYHPLATFCIDHAVARSNRRAGINVKREECKKATKYSYRPYCIHSLQILYFRREDNEQTVQKKQFLPKRQSRE
jgi:hypothetical protein